jgi:hypothetical protein
MGILVILQIIILILMTDSCLCRMGISASRKKPR